MSAALSQANVIGTPPASDPGDVTDDAFLGGRLQLLQSRRGLRAGIDAVFLAAAVPAESEDAIQILDAGTGSGVVGLSVLSRVPQCIVTGVDIDPELVMLARKNAERNNLTGRARFLQGDIRRTGEIFEVRDIRPNSFDHVVANPPFFEAGTVRRAPEPQKDRANVLAPDDLDKWVRFLTTAARAGGMLTMVHRADALVPLLKALEGRFGGLKVFPLFPRAGVPASRILVQGRKGTRSAMSLLPGLVLHDDDGGFTPPAEAVLRHGAGLPLADR